MNTQVPVSRTLEDKLPPSSQADASPSRPTEVPRGPLASQGVALLTAGRDKPYALGLADALLGQGLRLDFIGSDEVSSPELVSHPKVQFLNLRGEQSVEASLPRKMARVLRYYQKLLWYAFRARPKIFHILWNNKFEVFDRTLLMLYYKALGKRIVFTAHNVNAGTRDSQDTWINRATLRAQYRLSDHIFVHTKKMKDELLKGFGVAGQKVTVIPFGINNTVPTTSLSPLQAKQKLGLSAGHKNILFFGNIAPYKGLEYLVEAFQWLAKQGSDYRLIIVGRPKGSPEYWAGIEKSLNQSGLLDKIVQRIEYVPDEETEIYFKAADILVLPYTHIFQSGVLFLGYSFGLPVVATDVGSLREEIIKGQTGFVCRPRDPNDLGRAIHSFFESPLYLEREARRYLIRDFANERYSWAKVARLTESVYSQLVSFGVTSTQSQATEAI